MKIAKDMTALVGHTPLVELSRYGKKYGVASRLVATLGLADYVAELMMVNTRYQMLVDQRSMARATDTTDNSKTLRAELDELYDYITTVAFCQSVINPSEATALYVAQMNTYVEETSTAYKLRVAQAKANEEEEDKDESGEMKDESGASEVES